MVSQDFVRAAMVARKRFSRSQWLRLVDGIAKFSESQIVLDVASSVPDVLGGEGLWLVNRALGLRGSSSWDQVAGAMAAVDVLAESTSQVVTPVWTGPANGAFPVRRFDQVLYDLAAQASRRILIVTFAAYRVGHLCELLRGAVDRGAALTLVLEGEEASGGQLTHDALNAFEELRGSDCAIYCWRSERRERNAAGRPGKLHAKCAVVDDVALVGSGNLTEDAFSRNMELGLMVDGSGTADSIFGHFMALIERRELARVPFAARG